MGNRIRKGGIRRNPAVMGVTDHSLDGRKERIVRKMEELLLTTEAEDTGTDGIPIDFDRAGWRKGRL